MKSLDVLSIEVHTLRKRIQHLSRLEQLFMAKVFASLILVAFFIIQRHTADQKENVKILLLRFMFHMNG